MKPPGGTVAALTLLIVGIALVVVGAGVCFRGLGAGPCVIPISRAS